MLSIRFKLIVAFAFSRMISSTSKTIVWLRNDLRIHDNVILHEARLNSRNKNHEVICLYCFDPRHFAITPYGSLKSNTFRTKFQIESVANLRKNLQSIDNDLFVTFAKPEDVIPQLLIGCKNGEVLVQSEHAYEEKQVELKVEKAIKSQQQQLGGSIKLRRLANGASLYHPDDLPYTSINDIPDVFTPFLKKLEQNSKLREIFPTIRMGDLKLPDRYTIKLSSSSPSSLSSVSSSSSSTGFDYLPTVEELLHDSISTSNDKSNILSTTSSTPTPTTATTTTTVTTETTTNSEATLDVNNESKIPKGVLDFIGGEDAAIQRLQNWIWRDDNLKNYFDIRNGMLGEQYSSKFSPWLALGCISPRLIATEVKKYENERVSNKSTYWLIWELTCRDFFRYTCLKYGHRIFLSGGAKGIEKRWSVDVEKLNRWKNGMTGVPIVDANMRELKMTGFMSNRGRQIVASYLIFELNLDWRLGADHFESFLIDHDVYANYGNWNAMAGLTGGRINRFNMAKQSRDYDENGRYIHYWVPELYNVPAPSVFEPWLLSKQNQDRCKVRIQNPTTTTSAALDSSSSGSGSAVITTTDDDGYSTYPLPIPVQSSFEPRNDYNGNNNNNNRSYNSSGSGNRNNDRHHSSNRTYNSSNHKNSSSNSRPSR